MPNHLFSSWEIMPQAVMVCTGDVHVDGALLVAIVLVWILIRTK